VHQVGKKDYYYIYITFVPPYAAKNTPTIVTGSYNPVAVAY